ADQFKLRSIMLDTSQVLTGQDQACRTISILNSSNPSHCSFSRRTWTPYCHAWDVTQTRSVFHWLVCRTILALTDRVVSQHVNNTLLHQRRHTHAVLHVIGKHVEGTTEWQQA